MTFLRFGLIDAIVEFEKKTGVRVGGFLDTSSFESGSCFPLDCFADSSDFFSKLSRLLAKCFVRRSIQ